MKYNKNVLKVIILLILMSNLIACTPQQPIERNTYMMGTIVQFKVYDKNSDNAIEQAIKRVHEIEDKMSVNISESEINKVNNNAGIAEVKVSEETYEVIKKAVEYSELTNGAFDATIEPIVMLWDIGTENERVPSKEEINNALKLVNYKEIEFNDQNKSIKLKEKNQAIDLGGIAKGYAADEVNKIFDENNIESAFVSLGGNVYVRGNKVDGTLWNIGIQSPFDERNDYVGFVSVADKSIVTSGNYERYFMKDGIRYHHIFDPVTGYPSEKGLVSTTIISDNSIDGDALSTSIYILGLDKGMELVEEIDGVDAIFITQDRKVYATSGIKENLKITDKEFEYEER